MSTIKLSSITNKAKTSGPVIAGVTSSTATEYAQMASGDNSERVGIESGSLRYNNTAKLLEFYDGTEWKFILPAEESANALGIWAGGIILGYVAIDDMKYITISTLGDAQDFGNLTLARAGMSNGSCSSSTRGVFGGGYTAPAYVLTNVIDYITIATKGNAADFGDFFGGTATTYRGSCSSSTRGVFAGGYISSPTPARINTIEYITIATKGNATDFNADLTQTTSILSGCSSSIRGVFGGGSPSPSTVTNVMEYITIATEGTVTDFGDLTVARSDPAACASSTRGLFAAGKNQRTPVFIFDDIIDYITIATTGNAIYFGDLSVDSSFKGAASSSTRGVFNIQDANVESCSDRFEYVTIATLGNTIRFGDYFTGGYLYGNSACSNNHGGLL